MGLLVQGKAEKAAPEDLIRTNSHTSDQILPSCHSC